MATGVDNALVLPNDATFYITDGHAFNPSTVKKNKTVLARAALGDEVCVVGFVDSTADRGVPASVSSLFLTQRKATDVKRICGILLLEIKAPDAGGAEAPVKGKRGGGAGSGGARDGAVLGRVTVAPRPVRAAHDAESAWPAAAVELLALFRDTKARAGAVELRVERGLRAPAAAAGSGAPDGVLATFNTLGDTELAMPVNVLRFDTVQISPKWAGAKSVGITLSLIDEVNGTFTPAVIKKVRAKKGGAQANREVELFNKLYGEHEAGDFPRLLRFRASRRVPGGPAEDCDYDELLYELVPGGDLRVHETALRSLSPATMLAVMQYVFYETLDAILDLAAACVCQGDIKMPNVFLDHDDLTLLLGDVGGWQDLDKAIAKFIQAQVTPSHMAPEVATTYTKTLKSELYSLAVLVRSLGALQPEVAAWAFLDEDGSLTDESLALSRQAYVDAVVAASAGRPRKDRLETAQIDFLALIHDAAAKDPALRPQPSREALAFLRSARDRAAVEAKAALRVVLDAFKPLNNLFVNTSGRDFWGDLVRPHVESARLAEISRLEDSLGTPATDAAAPVPVELPGHARAGRRASGIDEPKSAELSAGLTTSSLNDLDRAFAVTTIGDYQRVEALDKPLSAVYVAMVDALAQTGQLPKGIAKLHPSVVVHALKAVQLFRAHVAVVAEKLSAAEAKKLGFGATALGKLKVLANMKDDEFDEVATIVINKYRELLSDKYSAEVVGHVLHQRLQDAVEQAPEFATKYTHPSGKAKVNLKVFTQFVLSALAIKLLYGAGVHSSCAFDPRNLNTAMLLPDFADL